jgi:hypothetical protein
MRSVIITTNNFAACVGVCRRVIIRADSGTDGTTDAIWAEHEILG